MWAVEACRPRSCTQLSAVLVSRSPRLCLFLLLQGLPRLCLPAGTQCCFLGMRGTTSLLRRVSGLLGPAVGSPSLSTHGVSVSSPLLSADLVAARTEGSRHWETNISHRSPGASSKGKLLLVQRAKNKDRSQAATCPCVPWSPLSRLPRRETEGITVGGPPPPALNHLPACSHCPFVHRPPPKARPSPGKDKAGNSMGFSPLTHKDRGQWEAPGAHQACVARVLSLSHLGRSPHSLKD